jgi:hypothetical protein
LPDQPARGGQDHVGARDQLVGRQDGAGLLVQAEEFDDVPDVLREDPLVTTRQDRDRACAQAAQFIAAGGIFKNVDRLEPDPTDREKLFEFQTTRSTRLPERIQGLGFGHRALQGRMT